LPFRFQPLPRLLRDPGLIGLIALGSAVASAVWVLVPLLFNWIDFQFSIKTIPYRVDLGHAITEDAYEKSWRNASTFGCLFLRYGASDYLMHLASDEDRQIGRSRFEMSRMEMKFDKSGNAFFVFKIPVHNRLGTQFKCFVDDNSQGTLGNIQEIIRHWQNIRSVDLSTKPRANRWWILFDTFACLPESGKAIDYCRSPDNVLPLEGIVNNFIPPDPVPSGR
jgi:hypothetical protein